MDTEQRTHTRWPLPTRSSTDRKLGGVAGGLGRAWRIDPILIRVAFVVLAVFGGSGVALYCAGWLLMRGDEDDVSAIEALAGRGRSSVSPLLTVVLIVVGLGSMGSVFSWGIPFWPVLIGAIVLVAIVSRRRGPHAWGSGASADDIAARASQWGQEFGDRAARWGQEFGQRAEGWWQRRCGAEEPATTGNPGSSADQSPIGATADAAGPRSAASDVPRGESASASPAVDAPAAAAAPPEPEDLLTDGRTPPSWDPLGAAPFAWDLPDPAQSPAPTGAPRARDRRGHRPGSSIARIALGLALIVGSVLAAGVGTQRFSMPWAVVAGVILGVLAVGMLIASLRGRGARLLIGPSIFVAVLTLGLTVTGIEGTDRFGGHTWNPASAADVEARYFWNAGDATLDLSGLRVPPGETVGTEITVGAGQARVIVPANVAVHAQCSATAGAVDCLGRLDDGVRPSVSLDRDGSATAGTLDITVHSNAGQAVLTSHE